MTLATEGRPTIQSDRDNPVQSDRLITLQGSWDHFKLIQQGCNQTPGVRLFYHNGTIELLMPGQLHETFSRIIGWMLTYYLAAKQIPFTPTGSVTQELEGQASAQADESYCLGDIKLIPDLSIEIVFSSGNIKKLDRYKILGVPEVWFWEDGVLSLYHLRTDRYEQIQTSELPGLNDLDLALLSRCVLMAETNSNDAITIFARTIGSL
jgi:Uma2 family endonuclease